MIVNDNKMQSIEKRLHEGFVLKERAKIVQTKYIKKYADNMKSKIRKKAYEEMLNDLTYILAVTEEEEIEND